MASLAGTVRWWEKVEEPTTVWQALLTDDGLEYYVNTETNETTWEKPEELYVMEFYPKTTFSHVQVFSF